jgi:SNF2 family DNA or RNA helicase
LCQLQHGRGYYVVSSQYCASHLTSRHLSLPASSQSSLRKLAWQYIIVDEGHRMKNAQSKFAQILGTVYQSRHRILLTG